MTLLPTTPCFPSTRVSRPAVAAARAVVALLTASLLFGLAACDSAGTGEDPPEETAEPPTASFTVSPASPKAGETVSFDASGSEAGSEPIASYEWDFDGDGSSDASGVEAEHVFEESGDYDVELTVTGEEGRIGEASQSVSVEEGGSDAPTARFTASTTEPEVGETVSFDASGSEAGSEPIASYTWDFDSDGETDASGTETEHVFEETGSYDVKLTVEDEEGQTGEAGKEISVQEGVPPTASFTASTTEPEVGETVSFDASGSEAGSEPIASYAWDFDSDGETDASGAETEYTFEDPGGYDVELTVEGEGGRTATAGKEISVQGVPPTARFTASTTEPETGETVSFDAGGSEAGTEPIASYTWDLDSDGSSDASGARVEHAFEDPGDYDVKLTVEGEGGRTASAGKELSVSLDNSAPTARFTYSPDRPVAYFGEATFDAGPSEDPDGDELTYSWRLAGEDGERFSDSETTDKTLRKYNGVEVELTVTDEHGASSSVSKTVETVVGKKGPPYSDEAVDRFVDLLWENPDNDGNYKYTETHTVYIDGGDPTEESVAKVRETVEAIAALMPGEVDFTFSRDDPGGDNVIPVRFREESVIREKCNCPGFFEGSDNLDSRRPGIVWISYAGSIGRETTNHLVVHELGHAAGFWHAGNDKGEGASYDSVMAKDQDDWQQFLRADLLAIEMLYRPEVERSMSAQEAAEELRDL